MPALLDDLGRVLDAVRSAAVGSAIVSSDGVRSAVVSSDGVRSSNSFVRYPFRFGARQLDVYARTQHDEFVPVGGLAPAVVGAGGAGTASGAGATLYLIGPEEIARLNFPSEAALAPYGALLECLGTDWLVLRSPDTGKILALDTRTREALYYPGDRVPPRDRAEFCRPLLHWLAILDGNVVVHAGAVGIDGRGVLVAGAGNAGKSTLVRLCLVAGFDFLGDNVVEVEPRDGGSVLHAAYPTFKVRRDAAVPVPANWPRPEWDDEAEKDIYFLDDSFRTQPGTVASAPLLHATTLVLDPRMTASPQRLDSARAFFLIAPNTVAQFPFFEEAVLKRTGAVVAAAPTWTAGRMSLDSIPQTVAGLALIERHAVGSP